MSLLRAAAPLLLLVPLSAVEPAAGLTLYASFDQGVTPDYAAGARSGEAAWSATAGVLAGAFRNADGGASFPPACNFNLPRGTVAFWVRPAADPRALVAAGRPKPTLVAAMNFQLMAEPRTNQWLFMTGTDLPGEDFTWSYAPSCNLERIPAGRWTHVALTWDHATGAKAIYLDGIEAIRGTSRHLRSIPSGSPLALGAGMPGDYDELLAWDRVLAADEISRVHADPAAIAAAARALPAPQDAPWEVTALPAVRPAADGLVDPGGSYVARIPVENRTARACTAAIALTLLDLWERPCGEPQVQTVALAAQAKSSITATFAAPRLGIFKVQAAIGGRTRDVASFGCVPPGNPPDHPFFGAHVQGSPGTPAFGRRLGFSRQRVHDMQQFTWWLRMEPERGQWNERCREGYRALSDLGYAHWGEWMAAPYWTVTLPGGGHPPRHDGYPRPYVPTDMEAVRAYVRKTLEWYPGIGEWEVWNEPNVSGFWAGSPKDYADLAAVMYAEAKRLRPDLTVYVQYGTGTPWYRDAAKAGLLTHADGVSFHAYAATADHPQSWARTVADIRKDLAAAGRPGMPIVDSEGGLSSSSFLRGLEHAQMPPESRRIYDFQTAAALIVQWRVTMMAAGVKAHYYYFLVAGGLDRDSDFGGRISLTDATGGPTPAAVAQNALVWQLAGGAFAQEVALPPGLRCYLFSRGDGTTLAVLWGEDGARATMAAPGNAIDLMGNPLPAGRLALGELPVYLRLPGAPAAAAPRLASATLTGLVAPQAAARTATGAKPPKPMDRFSLANECGPQRLLPLDLGEAATMGLVDAKAGDSAGGWLDEGPYNDLSMLAAGRHEWLGVPFRIGASATRCLVTMGGKTFPAGPATSGWVTVGRSVRALFFCHGANWVGAPGVVAATYEVRYADGTTVRLPVLTGRAIGNWWTDRGEEEDSRTVPLLAKDPQEPSHPWRFLRIWQWENPRSEVPVAAVRVLAGSPELTFATVGITAAVW